MMVIWLVLIMFMFVVQIAFIILVAASKEPILDLSLQLVDNEHIETTFAIGNSVVRGR